MPALARLSAGYTELDEVGADYSAESEAVSGLYSEGCFLYQHGAHGFLCLLLGVCMPCNTDFFLNNYFL